MLDRDLIPPLLIILTVLLTGEILLLHLRLLLLLLLPHSSSAALRAVDLHSQNGRNLSECWQSSDLAVM